MKPIRRLLDLMARRRLRRTAARRIQEMLAAPDSGRRLGYPAARRVKTMESLLRVPEDRSEAELQPDILLPCQLGDGLFGGARLQPEKRLQLAVLEDAILTFERSVGVDGARPRRLLGEVDAWVASDATDSPFAFVTICHTLNIDPDYIRGGLRRRRAHPDVATKRKPPLRRDANGTRHQVVVYLTAPRRIA